MGIHESQILKRSRGVVSRDISPDKTVVFKEHTGEYFCLNSNGRAIWNLIDSDTTVRAILDAFSKTAPPGKHRAARRDAGDYLESLLESGLLLGDPVSLSHGADKGPRPVLDTYDSATSEFYTFINDHAGRYVPVSALFEITYRCNHRCAHCYEDCPSTKRQEDLTTEEVKRILLQMHDAGTFSVTFSGGEPFIRKDLPSILEYARSLNFSINVFTNGTLVSPSDALRLAELAINAVHVSVYSGDPEVHDQITRVPGSHRATMNAISLLREHGISVVVKCPVMKRNFAGYRSMKDHVKALGCSVRVDSIITARDDGDPAPQRLMLDGSELEEVLLDPDSRRAGLPPGESGDAPLCNVFFSSLAISASGEVYPCNQLKIKLGDLGTDSFRSIWDNSTTLNELRGLRMSQLPDCRGCGKLRFCGRCPGHAWLATGSVTGASSLDCRLAAVREKLGIRVS